MICTCPFCLFILYLSICIHLLFLVHIRRPEPAPHEHIPRPFYWPIFSFQDIRTPTTLVSISCHTHARHYIRGHRVHFAPIPLSSASVFNFPLHFRQNCFKSHYYSFFLPLRNSVPYLAYSSRVPREAILFLSLLVVVLFFFSFFLIFYICRL